MTSVDLSRHTMLQLWVIVNNAPTRRVAWNANEKAAEEEIVRREQEMRAA